MKYVVKSRELKWAGKTLLKGAAVEPQADRDHKHIELLVKIGKVELAPAPKPVLKLAETQPAPIPAADVGSEPTPRRYLTRRMKTED
jgi:hypothetical protein